MSLWRGEGKKRNQKFIFIFMYLKTYKIFKDIFVQCTRVVWKVSDLNMKMAALVNES